MTDYIRDLRPAKWGSGISLYGSNPLIAHVRFGSKADIGAPPINVRFTPESRHKSWPTSGPTPAASPRWPQFRRASLAVSTIKVLTSAAKPTQSSNACNAIAQTSVSVRCPWRVMRIKATRPNGASNLLSRQRNSSALFASQYRQKLTIGEIQLTYRFN
jgi:hypothetical protein